MQWSAMLAPPPEEVRQQINRSSRVSGITPDPNTGTLFWKTDLNPTPLSILIVFLLTITGVLAIQDDVMYTLEASEFGECK